MEIFSLCCSVIVKSMQIYLQHISEKQRQRVNPPSCHALFVSLPGCHRELLSLCASLSLQRLPHQYVLTLFQNGTMCVGALRLHNQRPLCRQVKSQCEPYGGLPPVRTALYFFVQHCLGLVKDLHMQAHTEPISHIRILAVVRLI